jgi:hypothetical protein
MRTALIIFTVFALIGCSRGTGSTATDYPLEVIRLESIYIDHPESAKQTIDEMLAVIGRWEVAAPKADYPFVHYRKAIALLRAHKIAFVGHNTTAENQYLDQLHELLAADRALSGRMDLDGVGSPLDHESAVNYITRIDDALRAAAKRVEADQRSSQK